MKSQLLPGLVGLVMALGGVGCAALGASPVTTLPPDVHALPTASEVAEHPCRYGDVRACVAKCELDSQACKAAGVMFEFDGGFHSDPAVASGFYSRACTDNYAPGCNNLAWLYLRGSGVPRDQLPARGRAAVRRPRRGQKRGHRGGLLPSRVRWRRRPRLPARPRRGVARLRSPRIRRGGGTKDGLAR